jgi:hypothetical protein
LVGLELEFLGPHYQLLGFSDKTDVGATGLLEIGQIISSERKFRLRWDEKAGLIDIDMFEEGSEIWKKGGFEGHHSVLVSAPPERKFQIQIKYRGAQIFNGILTLLITTRNRQTLTACCCIVKPEKGS